MGSFCKNNGFLDSICIQTLSFKYIMNTITSVNKTDQIKYEMSNAIRYMLSGYRTEQLIYFILFLK